MRAFDRSQKWWPWMARWPAFHITSRKVSAFRANYIKSTEARPILSVTEMQPRESHFGSIFTGVRKITGMKWDWVRFQWPFLGFFTLSVSIDISVTMDIKMTDDARYLCGNLLLYLMMSSCSLQVKEYIFYDEFLCTSRYTCIKVFVCFLCWYYMDTLHTELRYFYLLVVIIGESDWMTCTVVCDSVRSTVHVTWPSLLQSSRQTFRRSYHHCWHWSCGGGIYFMWNLYIYIYIIVVIFHKSSYCLVCALYFETCLVLW